MAYCTSSDIQSEFKNLTYTSGGITSGEVDGFIEQEDAFIDGIIGRKYVVPATGTYTLRILKTISIQLVVSRIKRILAVKTGRPELDQDSSSNLFAMAKTKLDDIAEGRLILSDATLAESNDGVDSFAVSDDIKHVVKRDEQQW